jgi:Carboxypeptidase regulatory-like domain/Short C-terminal domain
MHSMSRNARSLVLAGIILTTGCAMRVTGVVRDVSTGAPIGGVVLTANDGRNRLSTSDPSGRYAVKTDRQPSTLVASAPGYVTRTVAVPGTQRYPVVTIDLERASPVTGSAVYATPLAPVPGPRTGPGAAKLRQLQELYDQGTISEDEYRRTRKRVLDEL